MSKNAKFSNGKFHINVECVADLIKELKCLPPDTPVRDATNGADLVLFNSKGPNTFVDIDDAGMWSGEDK